jgi:hypothetical protein
LVYTIFHDGEPCPLSESLDSSATESFALKCGDYAETLRPLMSAGRLEVSS